MRTALHTLIVLLTLALFTGCGDDSDGGDDGKKCDPACETYQTCDDGSCKLADGYCENDTHCSGEKSECNTTTHLCEAPGTPECTNGETKCTDNTLSTCVDEKWSETDCTASGKVCETENNQSQCVANSGPLTIAQVKALDVEQMVTTKGVVTHVITLENQTVGGIYIQDGTEADGALFVHIQNGVSSPVKRGDEIEVSGLVWKRFGINRLGSAQNTPAEVPTFKILGQKTVPAAKSTTGKDLVEGDVDMLVTTTGGPWEVIQMGEAPIWHTKLKAANGDVVLIDSKLYRFNENNLKVGSVVTKLDGVVGSYQEETDNSFLFTIIPRDGDDIVFTSVGTEGNPCGDSDPACLNGLVCRENICIVKQPCDNLCTELQYCNLNTDQCVDIPQSTVAQVRQITEDQYVWTEGVLTKIDRSNAQTANFYIQDGTDSYSGIQVYYKNAPVPSLTEGTTIRVVGWGQDYQGFIEIGSADDQPIITTLGDATMPQYKAISAAEMTAENLYLMVELSGAPFVVTATDQKYATVKDKDGNSFLIGSKWLDGYFFEGDRLATLKGILTYRYNNGTHFVVTPRNIDEIAFSGPCDDLCTDTQVCDEENNTCLDVYTSVTVDGARKSAVDTAVVVSGTITGFAHPYKNDQPDTTQINGLFLQDESGAIFIYPGTIDTGELMVGDAVTVRGFRAAYNGMPQIQGGDYDLEIIQTGAETVPEAVSITIDQIGETFEAQLVTVNGVFTVTTPASSSNGWMATLKDESENTFKISTRLYRFSDDNLDNTGKVYTAISGFIIRSDQTEGVASYAIAPEIAADMVAQ